MRRYLFVEIMLLTMLMMIPAIITTTNNIANCELSYKAAISGIQKGVQYNNPLKSIHEIIPPYKPCRKDLKANGLIINQ